MIILMDNTDLGKRCKSYLEGLLSKTEVKDGSIVVWPHKNHVTVSDIDLFNEIAQETKNRELSTTGGFNYNIRFGSGMDYCTVSLPLELSKDFRNKYGGKYTLRR